MKIIQVTPTLGYGDAVGNNVVAIDKLLKRNGYSCMVYSNSFDPRIPDSVEKKLINEWKAPKKDDILIYHIAAGWSEINKIIDAKCRKIAIYHNVTPPHFFKGYDNLAYKICRKGVKEVKSLKDVFDYCIADTEFNKQDLVSYGYSCPVDAVPILINFNDYAAEPSQEIIQKYKDTEGTKILFVGRIVPNKMYEDLIRSFYSYKNVYDPKAKLFLVGKYNENDSYYKRLQDYIKELQLEDVYFSGHISFRDILAYYSVADIFLCESEHEGFCVPLVEAMYFKVPIIAYDSCAVGETLGDGGVLINNKDSMFVASVINTIMQDEQMIAQLKEKGTNRLKWFSNDRIEKELMERLNAFIKG